MRACLQVNKKINKRVLNTSLIEETNIARHYYQTYRGIEQTSTQTEDLNYH